MLLRLSYCLIVCVLPLLAAAEDADIFHNSGLPIPRFVSLKSENINVRVGPGKRYPIQWVYQRKDLPVEVIEEFGHWRKIRDHQGDEGWTHHNLLSGRRTALIVGKEERPLHLARDEKSPIVVNVAPEVPCTILSCDDGWCHLNVESYDGWIQRQHVWGIYEGEAIEAR